LFKVETNKRKKEETTERAFGDSHKGNGTEKNDDTIKCQAGGHTWYTTACDISHKMLAFGGGGRKSVHESVEKDFDEDPQDPVQPFDNEPLCEQEDFEIVDMEIHLVPIEKTTTVNAVRRDQVDERKRSN
jgi:hypothetical protein